MTSEQLYLDLLKKCLTNTIYRDPAQDPWSQGVFDASKREFGLDWPLFAHTMIGQRRLENLHACVEHVLDRNVPGDLLEAGVWRGGAVILMRGILKARGVLDRTVWAADSFRGLPRPNPAEFPADSGDMHHEHKALAVSLEEVRDNFKRYDLLDQRVRFLEGWFQDTLPSAPIGQLALLRIDGDMYESTIQVFDSLYPKLSPGGIVIVDDYHAVPACKQATHDFRNQHGIRESMHEIDGVGVFWEKATATAVRPAAASEGFRAL